MAVYERSGSESWDRAAGVERPAHLNGLTVTPGRSAKLAGKLADAREHQRAAVKGLSAIIEGSPGATARRHPVVNVSEQGMLIDGLVEPVGARIPFVLAGCGIDHAGSGRVAHRRGRSAGVAIDHWHGAPEAIRALVRSETEDGPRAEAYITDWS